jgi:hypothetical protein
LHDQFFERFLFPQERLELLDVELSAKHGLNAVWSEQPGARRFAGEQRWQLDFDGGHGRRPFLVALPMGGPMDHRLQDGRAIQ